MNIWIDPEHKEWHELSERINNFVDRISGRGDIIVTVSPDVRSDEEKKKRSRPPGVFYPTLGRLHLDASQTLPKNLVELSSVDLASKLSQRRYPAFAGVSVHECGHAKHTLHNARHDNRFINEWIAVLEEPRSERKMALGYPQYIPHLRAASKHIFGTDAFITPNLNATKELAKRYEAARVAILLLGRADAEILTEDEVENIRDICIQALGKRSFEKLRKVWLDAFELEDDDAEGMIALGIRVHKIVDPSAEAEDNGKEEQRTPCGSPEPPKKDEKPKDENPKDDSEDKDSDSGDSEDKDSDSDVSKDKGSDSDDSEGEGSDSDDSEGEGSDSDDSKGEGSDSDDSEGEGSDSDDSKGEGSDSNDSKGEGSDSNDSKGEGSDSDDSEGEGSDSKDSEGEGSGNSQDSKDDLKGDSEPSGMPNDDSKDEGSEGEGSDSEDSEGEGSDSGDSDSSNESGNSKDDLKGDSEPSGMPSDDSEKKDSKESNDGDSEEDADAESDVDSGSADRDIQDSEISDLIKEAIVSVGKATEHGTVEAKEDGLVPIVNPQRNQVKEDHEHRQEINTAKGKVKAGKAKKSKPGTFSAVPYISLEEPSVKDVARSRAIGAAIEKAQFRDVHKTTLNSMIPPGRFNVRQAMNRTSQVAMRQEITATPWKQTRRREIDNPPITLAVASDISGSMDLWQREVSSFTWAFSQAVHRLKGKSGAVAWNSDTFSLIKPGIAPEKIPVSESCGGSTGLPGAMMALDGLMDLSFGEGVRVLAIITDGDLMDYGKIQKIISKLSTYGVKVMWILTDPTGWKPKHATVAILNNPEEFGKVVGMKVIEALSQA